MVTIWRAPGLKPDARLSHSDDGSRLPDFASDWRMSHPVCRAEAGASEVLQAARHRINSTTTALHRSAKMTCVHLLFDRRTIINAEGAAFESFHPVAWALRLWIWRRAIRFWPCSQSWRTARPPMVLAPAPASGATWGRHRSLMTAERGKHLFAAGFSPAKTSGSTPRRAAQNNGTTPPRDQPPTSPAYSRQRRAITLQTRSRQIKASHPARARRSPRSRTAQPRIAGANRCDATKQPKRQLHRMVDVVAGYALQYD